MHAPYQGVDCKIFSCRSVCACVSACYNVTTYLQQKNCWKLLTKKLLEVAHKGWLTSTCQYNKYNTRNNPISNDSVSVLSKISRVNRERLGGPTHPLLTKCKYLCMSCTYKQHELLIMDMYNCLLRRGFA